MKTGVFVLLAAMLFCANAPAFIRGNDGGNGGYTVRCDHASPQGDRVEVLDYHEMRTKFVPGTYTLSLGTQGDEWDRVRNVLFRLIRLDSARASRYAKEADVFKQTAHFVPHVNLPGTHDLGRPFLETGCQAEQAAIQFKNPLPGQSRYMVSASIYSQLSDDQKAGLILHEIIYREALQLGATDSMGARFFNAVISSDQINMMMPAEYNKSLAAAGLVDPSIPNSPIWMTDPSQMVDGKAGRPYAQDISGFAQSPKGVPLTYRILSGPKWLTVAGSELKGVPGRGDIGVNSWLVEASDGSGAATATLRMEVLPSAPGPFWIRAVNQLWAMQPGGATEINLPGFLQQATGKVTFAVNGAPAWLKLNPMTGLMDGTPGIADTGAFAFEAVATDETGSSSARFEFTVSSTNDLMVWADNVAVIDINSPKYLNAQSPGPLTFRLHGAGPGFLSLSAAGVLTMRPGAADIGIHSIAVEVSAANSATLLVPFRIIVQKAPHFPTWDQKEFHFHRIKAGVPFLSDISQYAHDPNGDRLTFSLQWGDHHWLTVAPDGTLSGTPGKQDIGDSTFLVMATNADNEGTQATVYIEVVP